MPTSRRTFLRLTGSALATASVAATALQDSAAAPAPEATAVGAGSVALHVTDSSQRYAPAAPVAWTHARGVAKDAVLLQPRHRFQAVEGFGGAFTDAACWVMHQLPDAERASLIHQLFHPSEMNLSVCRTCIGASDYSRSVFSYDDGAPDPDLTRFSIDHDREYILPVLREARAANPDLFLFSSPWSPPGWMKSNNSMLGGNMQRRYMPSYANYFLKFLQAYEQAGVPVQAVSIQNEVDTDQDSRMPACAWPQEYEADFVRMFLGPLFKKSNVKTAIWLVDHNYNLWGRAIAELETPDVTTYSKTIAWHGYVGKVEWIKRVRDAFPDVEMRWTEGGPDYTAPDYLTDWVKWSSTFTGILRNGCASITTWNLALDEQGRPNLGPFPCGGLVMVDSRTRQISYSGQYHAIAHYSRGIKRGAVHIESNSSAKDLDHCAFSNPDGSMVAVLTNRGAARTCQLVLGSSVAKIDLPENSVVTASWK